MSEEQLNGSAGALKAGRRGAMAVADTAPETAMSETATIMDAVAETAVETADVVPDTLAAEAEAVAEAAPVAVTEAVAEIPEELAVAGEAFAERSMRRFQAMAEAGKALTLGAQEASRTWLTATQSGMKLQGEGFQRLAACRTPLDLMTVQGELALRGFESVMEAGQSVARTSTKAIDDAGQALRAGA